MSVEFTRKEFNKLATNVQNSLKAQGVIIIEPNEEIVDAGNPELDELMQDDFLAREQLLTEEEEDDESGLFLNTYVRFGEKRYRLTFASLDNDFLKFLDKDKEQVNEVRNAIVHTVEKHGVEKANEGIVFEVELTQKGVSSISGKKDLLG